MTVPAQVAATSFTFAYDSGDAAHPLRPITLGRANLLPYVPDRLGQVWLRIDYAAANATFMTRIPLDVSASMDVKLDLGAIKIINDGANAPRALLNLDNYALTRDMMFEPSQPGASAFNVWAPTSGDWGASMLALTNGPILPLPAGNYYWGVSTAAKPLDFTIASGQVATLDASRAPSDVFANVTIAPGRFPAGTVFDVTCTHDVDIIDGPPETVTASAQITAGAPLAVFTESHADCTWSTGATTNGFALEPGATLTL